MDMQKIKGIAYPNGKQIVSVKDADGKVLWSAGGAVEVDDLWIGDGESVFFSKRTQPLAQAIVRGGCHISVDNPTPDNIGTIVCNNGEVSMSNEGVISVSGSPSYFDLNEERYNLPNLFGGLGVQDEYNMLTGVITRNAQVYALRGSMDWVEQSIEGQSYFALPTASYKVIISTHFHECAPTTLPAVGQFVIRNGYYVFNYDGVNDNIADFENYLDECYAAGEAVLVVGARFVSITEQDDAFDLQQINGRNEVKLFVNDEYSTIALKYKALYPPNNEVWYITSTGAKAGFGSASFRNESGNTLTFTDEANEELNCRMIKLSGDFYSFYGWAVTNILKYIYLPKSYKTYSNPTLNSARDLTGIYFFPLNMQDIGSIIDLSKAATSLPISSLRTFPNAKEFGGFYFTATALKYIRVLRTQQAKEISYFGTANYSNFRNICHIMPSYKSLGGYQKTRFNVCKKVAYYVPSSLLPTYLANEIYYHFYPIPTYWLF